LISAIARASIDRPLTSSTGTSWSTVRSIETLDER
jgi:hypothetical protein